MRTRAFHPRDTRVVGTAIGLCTPHGFDASALVDAMADASTRAPRTQAARVDDAALESRLAALVSTADQRRMDRLTRFGALAGLACVRASGLRLDDTNRDRIGVIFTSTFGAVASTDEFIASAMPRLRGASPLLFPYTVQNACTGMVTLLLGVRGVNTTVSGINPVLYARDVLRTGRATAVLAGGYDELTPRIADAFGARTPAAGIDEGIDDVQPIGAVAEGAAAVMLETSDHAAARGAVPLFEVLGTGSAVNLCASGPATADNMRHVDPDAITRAMRAALDDAATTPDAIDLVVGLARADNGQVASEDAALGTLFGVVPEVCRPKPALGDLLGASDVLAIALAAAQHARAAIGAGAASAADDARLVLVNGYQLGGHVSSVLLRFPGGR